MKRKQNQPKEKQEAHRRRGEARKRMTSSEKDEERILWISLLAGAAFAVAEFINAMFTHSQSVLMDAAYDSSELVVIILTLFLTPLFHRPISEKRPYGFLQAESVFVIIKNFMLLSVSLGLMANSLTLALSGGKRVDGNSIALFQIVLGIASLVVYLIMAGLNRSLSSPTVKAELFGWKLDIRYSMGMACAFFGSTFLDRTPLAFLSPYFDQIVAIAIVIGMLPENIKMLWASIQDVFLFAPGEELVEKVKEICEPQLQQFGFESLFYDITRTGRKIWISVYFKIEEENLPVRRLEKASETVQAALEEQIPDSVSELILMPDESGLPKEVGCPL